ncbi:radical SAM protein [Chloroflexota bacterium]
MANLLQTLLPRALRLLFPGIKVSFVFDRRDIMLPQQPEGINLYVHLPFCRNICHFCPYVRIPYNAELSSVYQKTILRELESYKRIWGDIQIESVYFGGGTPSLTPEIVETTMSWLASNFHLNNEAGIEIHPLDVDKTTIRIIKDCGITKASLGVQSYNENIPSHLPKNKLWKK